MSKVVDNLSIISLLADLLEELLVEHAEDLKFLGLINNNLVDALGLHIDWFAHFRILIMI